MRVLHPGYAVDFARAPRNESVAQRRPDSRGHCRSALSLHGLPEHREVRPGRRRPDADCESDADESGGPAVWRYVIMTTAKARPAGAATPRVEAGQRRWIGKSVKRVEDRRLLVGKGRYIDDLKLPRMA